LDGLQPLWKLIDSIAFLARPDGARVVAIMVNIDTTNVSWHTLKTAARNAMCAK
jgi:hypothetical protein